jgi:hypothetical protein
MQKSLTLPLRTPGTEIMALTMLYIFSMAPNCSTVAFPLMKASVAEIAAEIFFNCKFLDAKDDPLIATDIVLTIGISLFN